MNPGKHSDNGGRFVPIFAGGGTRLPAHIGIFCALQDLDIEFDHLVGVSGGSIISSLYAAGLSLERIKHIAMDTDFLQFRGFSLLCLLRHGGLSSGDRFEYWLDELLQGRTFNQLDKELHVVATDVRSGKPVVFDRRRTPDVRVSQAVRYSMSIPLVFSFKRFGPHLMVDGSILSEEALHQDWAGDGTPMLCFRLRGEYENDDLPIEGWFPIKNYVSLLIRTFMISMSREYVNDRFWHSTIVINTGRSSPVDFKLSKEQKLGLYNCGYSTAMEIIPYKLMSRKD